MGGGVDIPFIGFKAPIAIILPEKQTGDTAFHRLPYLAAYRGGLEDASF